MNKLENALVRTKDNVLEICADLKIEFDDSMIENIEQCANCSFWNKKSVFRRDVDANPICNICWTLYGY